jgi:hypothetical protein
MGVLGLLQKRKLAGLFLIHEYIFELKKKVHLF